MNAAWNRRAAPPSTVQKAYAQLSKRILKHVHEKRGDQ